MREYWTDAQMLYALDLRADGLTCDVIGEMVGRSKGAIAGLLKRIRDEDQPDECKKPENRDGGMDRYWWDERPMVAE